MSFNKFSNIKTVMRQIPIASETDKYLAFNADNEIVSTSQTPDISASSSSAASNFPYTAFISYDLQRDTISDFSLSTGFPTPREVADYRDNDSIKYTQFMKNTYLIIQFVIGNRTSTITTPIPPLGYIDNDADYLNPILEDNIDGRSTVVRNNGMAYDYFDYYYFYGDLSNNEWVFGLDWYGES